MTKRSAILTTIISAVVGPVITVLMTSAQARSDFAAIQLWRVFKSPVPVWLVVVVSAASCGAYAFIAWLTERRHSETQGDEILSPLEQHARIHETTAVLLREIHADIRSRLAKARLGTEEPNDPDLSQLIAYCNLAGSLFQEVEVHFYALIAEASIRMKAAYASSGRGSREIAEKTFLDAFEAGRNFAPYKGTGRTKMAWIAGMQGQLLLDLAMMARLCVAMPTALRDEMKANPRRDTATLFDEWFPRATTLFTISVANDFAGDHPPWAPELLDNLISAWDDENGQSD